MTDNSTDALLKTRGSTHGEFSDHARVTQGLKEMARTGATWKDMNNSQREAVDMILHKVGRIVCGNPNFDDHWADIQGYARLAEKRPTILTPTTMGGMLGTTLGGHGQQTTIQNAGDQ